VNGARVYVRREVADRFVDELVAAAGRLRLGDPRRWDVDIGPLACAEHLPVVRDAVDEAIAAGAERLTGGPADMPGVPGPFFAPAVLRGATPEMRVLSEPLPGAEFPAPPVDRADEA